MSNGDTSRIIDWAEVRQHAETRFAMYIGSSQESGHRTAILDCLRLVWQAKVFRRPQSVTIDLSPTQYILRAECGPLIKPVQQIFSFGNTQRLSETWGKEWQAYFERISHEDEEKGIEFLRQRHRYGWRYCFSGPTGPRLKAPSYPFVFAHQLIWGLRTDEGLWCEEWADGQPVGSTFLVEKASPFGLLVVADLDPQWFSGLPFTEEDAGFFSGLSHHRYVSQPKYEPQPLWTPSNITAIWHPENNLVSDRTLSVDGLQELL